MKKFLSIIFVLMLAFGCSVFEDEHESSHCYVYAAAWLSEPDTANATAESLMSQFPAPAGAVTDVLDYLHGKHDYYLASSPSLALIDLWLRDMRCWIQITNGQYNHVLIVTAILSTEEAHTVWGLDADGWYTELEFEVVTNNWTITTGRYSGYTITGAYGVKF